METGGTEGQGRAGAEEEGPGGHRDLHREGDRGASSHLHSRPQLYTLLGSLRGGPTGFGGQMSEEAQRQAVL